MGHALWRPSTGVEIGDVGYIHDGGFRPLFNVIKDEKKLKDYDCGQTLQFPEAWSRSTEAYLKPQTLRSQSIVASSLSAGVEA